MMKEESMSMTLTKQHVLVTSLLLLLDNITKESYRQKSLINGFR